ncbi:MAG: protease complex subunit PrcB family protein [Phycisphaeraceae bacterium]
MKNFKSLNCSVLCAMLVAVAFVASVGLAASAQINLEPVTITVLPDSPTPADSVVIRHDLTFNTGGYRIGGSAVTFVAPDRFVIDVFVQGPDPGDPVTQAITFLQLDSDLGALPAGDYPYTSRLVTIPRSQFPDPPTEAIFQQFPPATRAGTFTVVPEPATLTPFVLGGWALTRRQRQP